MAVRLRRTLHFAAAELLYCTGALRFWRFLRKAVLRKPETCVLGLHRVLTRPEQARTNSPDGMVLTGATFARLLGYLQLKFEVISLEEFLAEDGRRSRGTKPRCLLTFDDGWGDTYTTAYRQLKEFRMPAAVFLVTGSMEGKNGFWVEQVNGAFKIPGMREHLASALHDVEAPNGTWRSAEGVIEWLKRMPAKQRNSILKSLLSLGAVVDPAAQADGIDSMMTWEQAAEMTRNGFEMGAHTVTHPLLTYEDDAAAEYELRLGKEELEKQIGCRVRAFAYPNGDWNPRIRWQTKQAGYACAFTTRPGWYRSGQDRYTIPRTLLHEGNVTGRDGQFSPAMFNLTLAGRA